MPKHYRALTRLTHRDHTLIAAPGEVTDRIPVKSVPWLLQQGLIEPADAPADEPAPESEEE